MENTFIQAVCCAVSNQPGVANGTTLNGRLPETVKCAECGKEYVVEYNATDMNRIIDFANKLVVAARHAVNQSHPHHGNFVTVNQVEGEPLASVR